jgi:hypothetical protein
MKKYRHRNWNKLLAAWDGVMQKNKMAANVFWSAGKIWFLVGVALLVIIAGMFLI